MNSLVLLGVVVVIVVLLAVRQTHKLHKALSKHTSRGFLPQAITTLVLTAQVSELVRVVEHVDIVNVTAALILLVIIVATKHGTEGELR